MSKDEGKMFVLGALLMAYTTLVIIAVIVHGFAEKFCVQAGYERVEEYSFGKDWHIECSTSINAKLGHTFTPKQTGPIVTSTYKPVKDQHTNDEVFPYVTVRCDDLRTVRSCEWTTSQECWDRECKNLKDEDRTYDVIQGQCADGTRYECESTSEKECIQRNCDGHNTISTCSSSKDENARVIVEATVYRPTGQYSTIGGGMPGIRNITLGAIQDLNTAKFFSYTIFDQEKAKHDQIMMHKDDAGKTALINKCEVDCTDEYWRRSRVACFEIEKQCHGVTVNLKGYTCDKQVVTLK